MSLIVADYCLILRGTDQVAIYSTLGLAQTLAGALRNRGLFDSIFVVGFFIIIAGVTALALKIRPGGFEIGVALGVGAVYLMIFSRMGIPEERTHLFEYSIVAALIYQVLVERRRNGRRGPAPAVIAFIATALLGWLDEGIQWLLPNRFYDIRDVGFNALAGFMAVVASISLEWAKRRVTQGEPEQ